MKIPLEFEGAGILGSADDDPAVLDAPDPFRPFIDKAALGALAGPGASGAQRAHNIEIELAPIDARFKKIYIAKAAETKTPSPEPEADTLEKFLSPGGRRKENLRQFLKASLATGSTAAEIISHAAKHDLATANLLRECAAELGV